MTSVAIAIMAASIVVGFVAVAKTRDLVGTLPLVVDLWLAAGLLRLAATATWDRIATAFVLIVVRKVVATSLAGNRRAARWRSS